MSQPQDIWLDIFGIRQLVAAIFQLIGVSESVICQGRCRILILCSGQMYRVIVTFIHIVSGKYSPKLSRLHPPPSGIGHSVWLQRL